MAQDISPSVKNPSMMVDKEKHAHHHDKANADAALAFLDNEQATVVDIDEKVLVRKIDWRIVPLMCELTGQTGLGQDCSVYADCS